MMAAVPSTGKKKTQRWCFVPGCDVGYTKCAEKVSLFRAPACPEQFSKWARAIPRADKPLQENSAVCARHFDARFIVLDFTHTVNGTQVHIPRSVPRLKDDALPTIFPNLPKYISKTLPKERKRRPDLSHDSPSTKKSRKSDKSEACQSAEMKTQVHEQETAVDAPTRHFIYDLRRPSELWSVQTFKNKNAVSYQTAELVGGEIPPVDFHKIVVYEIEQERSTPTCSIFLAGLLHCRRDVPLQKDAQDLLAYAESLSVCSGIGGSCEFKQLNQSDDTRVSGQRLHSSACNGSVSQGSSLQMSQRCMQCKQMRKVLLSRLLRLRNKIRRPVVNTAGQRLRWAVRTLRRKKRKPHTLQDEIQLLQEKDSQIRSTVFEEKIKQLSKKQQCAVRACFEASKRRSLRGYKYEKEWLLECIILRTKSPREALYLAKTDAKISSSEHSAQKQAHYNGR